MGQPWKLASHRRDPKGGYISGTLTSGDGQDGFCVPWQSARLVGFIITLDAGGSTSGSTSVMVNRVRAEADKEMFSSVLSVAHNASDLFAEKTHADMASQVSLVRGDLVRVDIDAIPGGSDSAGLGWTAIFHIDS